MIMKLSSVIANQLIKTDAGISLIYERKNEDPHVKIMNAQETMDYIERTNCSIARFGDGEFDFIFHTKDEGYQKNSEELVEKLKGVLASEDKNLLVCIPYALNDIKGRSRKSMEFWYYWTEKNQHRKKLNDLIREYHGNNYVFGDTQISRPYIAWKDSKNADSIFPRLMGLWKDKDVLIVEGLKTRMGVGNDLFAGARSIKRILGPAQNAFGHYDEILQTIKDLHHGELVILALGPTATILASDLCKDGIRALDIGHLDIEYEWYRNKSTEHVAVAGKYTNEAASGDQVDVCEDDDYLSQIIGRVACD